MALHLDAASRLPRPLPPPQPPLRRWSRSGRSAGAAGRCAGDSVRSVPQRLPLHASAPAPLPPPPPPPSAPPDASSHQDGRAACYARSLETQSPSPRTPRAPRSAGVPGARARLRPCAQPRSVRAAKGVALYPRGPSLAASKSEPPLPVPGSAPRSRARGTCVGWSACCRLAGLPARWT